MSLINPADTIERQNEKLLQITRSLMRRVEQKTEDSGLAYAQFERAALLEAQVRERTHDLERTLDLLQDSNARLEEANHETETARTNLTEAIETINEGFALFDPNDELVLFNSRFCRDLDDVLPRLEQGLSFQDYVTLVSSSKSLALPRDELRSDWADRRLTRHGERHVVFNVSLEWDRWLQISEHRTSRGGTVILQTDVTNIIRLERLERDRMRDQQAQIFRATLDHLNQGVCIFDNQKVLVGWNARMNRLIQLPKGETGLGLEFTTLVDILQTQLNFSTDFSTRQFVDWALSDDRGRPIAFEVTRKGLQTLSVFAQEMPDRGFVVSFTDVTSEREAARTLSEVNELLERRVAERTQELGVALAEAERANASKSRFVAAASHDLLQPLSAAKLFVSSLSDQLDNGDLQNVLNKAENALSSVEQIIEALLDISRLDSGKAIFDVQPVRLNAILGPLADELTPVALAKGVDLRVIETSLTVESDPGYLRRILQNLISNAVRYTKTGKVLVGVRRYGASARLEVWDTGDGIAEEDQKLIFQEFKRLPSSSRETGLGLGLAIVERACANLGHPLGLWSEPGQGSCFSLNVPVHQGQFSTVPAPLRANPGQGESYKGMIVMLVENDAPLANAIAFMIESWGAEVIHCDSAEETLDLLSDIQMTPDVFLLDYQLGEGLSGIELHQSIARLYGQIPTAIVSADRTRALRKACKTHNLDLISKPIDKVRLFEMLGKAYGSAARP